MNTFQNTLRDSIEIDGIGYQSGIIETIKILPSPPNTGIQFRCKTTNETIPASIEFVSNTDFGVTISKGGIEIRGRIKN